MAAEFANSIRSFVRWRDCQIYILNYIDSLLVRQCVQKALNRGEAYHRLKRAVFHDNQGKFRVRTELEQNIWNECEQFITNSSIYCSAYIQSALYEAEVKAGRLEEAEITKRISPAAWQHINLRGRFEFQKQHMFNIDELISAFTQETGWQQLKEIDETARQSAYFTFSGRYSKIASLHRCNLNALTVYATYGARMLPPNRLVLSV